MRFGSDLMEAHALMENGGRLRLGHSFQTVDSLGEIHPAQPAAPVTHSNKPSAFSELLSPRLVLD